ncbi:hypothetical protein BN1211_5110 [Cyberlindnera jadinii]|uniref:Uncharacterized protein n=1 Tax=Cyberlindnera jadinii (strain ATCC 18201 / CBS 1600 / BCRC 20928 / JCM 3617 / NBRC 0987 / NRRL Y-1542) TaxID=983966 RepID=A0A0H5C8I3_CYBJN|nr:hypothetical protein BN1211_5110 [Cyberlindnera jadinii]
MSNETAQPPVQSDGEKTTPSASASPVKPTTLVERLQTLVLDSPIRSAWFLSNLVVVTNSLLYLIFLRYFGFFKSVWYRSAFIGAIGTFGIVVYQSFFANKKSTSLSVRQLLSDDNVHYLYDALIWLFLPTHFLALIPFLSFSFFHVLNFTSSDLLPALKLAPGLATKIQNFSQQYHEFSRREAAAAELLLLIQLVFQALFFRKWSWITLIAYAIFIKVKSEGSVFTRHVLKTWEVRIDGLVSNQQVPPAVKQQWNNFKRLFKTLDNYSLIHKVEGTTETEKKSE